MPSLRRKQPAPPEPTGVWRDVTSYSQSDPVPRVPRSWEMKVNGDLRLTVTRYVGYPPDQWLMTCRPFWDLSALDSKDAEEAKREALSQLHRKLEDALRALPFHTQP